MDEVERTTTHDVFNAMAIIADQTPEMPLAGIAYQIAELNHDDELTRPADVAQRLLHIGAALWRNMSYQPLRLPFCLPTIRAATVSALAC